MSNDAADGEGDGGGGGGITALFAAASALAVVVVVSVPDTACMCCYRLLLLLLVWAMPLRRGYCPTDGYDDVDVVIGDGGGGGVMVSSLVWQLLQPLQSLLMSYYN